MLARLIHTSLFLFLVASLGTSPLSRGEDSPDPRFITTLGTRNLFDGKLTLKVYEEKSMINYTLTRKTKTDEDGISPSVPRIKKGANWFIFPVSAGQVWIYEGGDVLTLYTTDDPIGLDKDSYTFITSEHPTAKIVKNAPKEVLDRLPKSMKEKHDVK
jgi:hypothetical protein